jgi:hypothetical protein
VTFASPMPVVVQRSTVTRFLAPSRFLHLRCCPHPDSG